MLTMWIALALADEPPPPGYVEPCTEEVCGGAKAETCRASYQGREACERLEQQGMTQACRTSGASVWSEVFCRGPVNGTADPVAPPAVSRCDSAAPGVVGALGLALVLGAVRRKR